MPRKKDADSRLERIAVTAEDRQPLRWSAVPEWAVLEEPRVTFLWAGPLQRERMARVTKAEYVKALQQHLPEVIERGEADQSWLAFRACCEERGQWAPSYHETQKAKWAAQAAAKRQADPSSLLDEYGLPRHPGDRATPEVNRYEQERQRLPAIANAAGPRWFTN